MTPRLSRSLARVVAAWLGLAACADGTAPPDRGAPGLALPDPAALRDTVGAKMAPLRVLIRGSDSLPAARVAVRFHTIAYVYGGVAPYLILGKAFPSDTIVHDTTNAEGYVEVAVRLGDRIGSVTVDVSAPDLNMEAVASYTILPGAPVALRAIPADTAVYVGRTYTLRSAMVDRLGNPHDELRATHATESAKISLSGMATVSGVAFGRANIVARYADYVDTAHVSVLPIVGTVAAHVSRRMVGDSIGLAVMGLDATGYNRFAVETQPRTYDGEEPPGHEMPPRWDPTGTRVVYHQSMAMRSGNYDGSDERRIYLSDLAGQSHRLLASSPFYTEVHPDWAPDGVWIYFAARIPGEYYLRIWRVHPDGTGLEPVGDAPPDADDTWPAVSSNGVWLAYVGGFPARVRVRRIDTGEGTALAVGGTSPRWSPSGDLVAYVASGDYSGNFGQIRVARPDGTGDRTVVTGQAYAAGIDWSADGNFLVAATGSYGALELIEVATGERVPLPFGERMSQPAWRPGSTR